MTTMSLLPLHVVAGSIAILAGLIALYVLKGASLHRKSGMVFVASMLLMAVSGGTIAVGRAGAAINVPAALVTAYLVVTALATVRPPTARLRRIERAAMVAAYAIGGGSVLFALSGAARGGMAFPLVMFALVALLAGEGDRRMLRTGGLTGAPRLRRHLWRMCAALFIASASFFLGPIRRIPEPLRIPALRLIPLLVLLTMAFWLWRLHRRRTAERSISTSAPEAIRT
jgi:hypothetical protein